MTDLYFPGVVGAVRYVSELERPGYCPDSGEFVVSQGSGSGEVRVGVITAVFAYYPTPEEKESINGDTELEAVLLQRGDALPADFVNTIHWGFRVEVEWYSGVNLDSDDSIDLSAAISTAEKLPMKTMHRFGRPIPRNRIPASKPTATIGGLSATALFLSDPSRFSCLRNEDGKVVLAYPDSVSTLLLKPLQTDAAFDRFCGAEVINQAGQVSPVLHCCSIVRESDVTLCRSNQGLRPTPRAALVCIRVRKLSGVVINRWSMITSLSVSFSIAGETFTAFRTSATGGEAEWHIPVRGCTNPWSGSSLPPCLPKVCGCQHTWYLEDYAASTSVEVSVTGHGIFGSKLLGKTTFRLRDLVRMPQDSCLHTLDEPIHVAAQENYEDGMKIVAREAAGHIRADDGPWNPDGIPALAAAELAEEIKITKAAGMPIFCPPSTRKGSYLNPTTEYFNVYDSRDFPANCLEKRVSISLGGTNAVLEFEYLNYNDITVFSWLKLGGLYRTVLSWAAGGGFHTFVSRAIEYATKAGREQAIVARGCDGLSAADLAAAGSTDDHYRSFEILTRKSGVRILTSSSCWIAQLAYQRAAFSGAGPAPLHSRTTLHLAVLGGNRRTLTALQRHPLKHHICSVDALGFTPFHMALQSSITSVYALLDSGRPTKAIPLATLPLWLSKWYKSICVVKAQLSTVPGSDAIVAQFDDILNGQATFMSTMAAVVGTGAEGSPAARIAMKALLNGVPTSVQTAASLRPLSFCSVMLLGADPFAVCPARLQVPVMGPDGMFFVPVNEAVGPREVLLPAIHSMIELKMWRPGDCGRLLCMVLLLDTIYGSPSSALTAACDLALASSFPERSSRDHMAFIVRRSTFTSAHQEKVVLHLPSLPAAQPIMLEKELDVEPQPHPATDLLLASDTTQRLVVSLLERLLGPMTGLQETVELVFGCDITIPLPYGVSVEAPPTEGSHTGVDIADFSTLSSKFTCRSCHSENVLNIGAPHMTCTWCGKTVKAETFWTDVLADSPPLTSVMAKKGVALQQGRITCRTARVDTILQEILARFRTVDMTKRSYITLCSNELQCLRFVEGLILAVAFGSSVAGPDPSSLVQAAFRFCAHDLKHGHRRDEAVLSWIQEASCISRDSVSMADASSDVIYCPACMDDFPSGATLSMGCGHAFCQQCWSMHLMGCLEQHGSRAVTCCECPATPACRWPVDGSVWLTCLPSPALHKYTTFIELEYVKQRQHLRICSNPRGCDRVVVQLALEGGSSTELSNGAHLAATTLSNLEMLRLLDQAVLSRHAGDLPIFRCECGHSFCGRCGLASHYPADCTVAAEWRGVINADIELASSKYMKQNFLPCPFCRMYVQKMGGCRHMRCASCQEEFCWNCGAKWTGYGHRCPIIQLYPKFEPLTPASAATASCLRLHQPRETFLQDLASVDAAEHKLQSILKSFGTPDALARAEIEKEKAELVRSAFSSVSLETLSPNIGIPDKVDRLGTWAPCVQEAEIYREWIPKINKAITGFFLLACLAHRENLLKQLRDASHSRFPDRLFDLSAPEAAESLQDNVFSNSAAVSQVAALGAGVFPRCMDGLPSGARLAFLYPLFMKSGSCTNPLRVRQPLFRCITCITQISQIPGCPGCGGHKRSAEPMGAWAHRHHHSTESLLCLTCASTCHRGHQVTYAGWFVWTCACSAGSIAAIHPPECPAHMQQTIRSVCGGDADMERWFRSGACLGLLPAWLADSALSAPDAAEFDSCTRRQELLHCRDRLLGKINALHPARNLTAFVPACRGTPMDKFRLTRLHCMVLAATESLNILRYAMVASGFSPDDEGVRVSLERLVAELKREVGRLVCTVDFGATSSETVDLDLAQRLLCNVVNILHDWPTVATAATSASS